MIIIQGLSSIAMKKIFKILKPGLSKKIVLCPIAKEKQLKHRNPPLGKEEMWKYFRKGKNGECLRKGEFHYFLLFSRGIRGITSPLFCPELRLAR
ncbi:MAG: hypothetical protein DWB56_15925 [Candidatus Jettenia sp.]|uniref:Uncharacterized protein n=1 Tax=Candidatus Jettenia caeni TaxID=247490 RepID=I3IPM1_9BACT|nr:MAG: hypothetical protein EDM77_15330 [Candidatus Jettenia sp. AMX1]MBC6930413.1 hypothetical protein [Candidatus Jettenia sp.]MCE7882097.1 hypothetical protein [Candidatus Jettenia sp. AMX1]MCQ3928723.1 hypothetical protein [Candidatus Jettenia sp.]GAB63666.1 hypothetical protein KSU1_D0357 [Candidatus Jettenia caeni]